MSATITRYSETFAALLRKHNQGLFTVTAFTAAQAALRNEVIDDPGFVVLGPEFDDILEGIELIRGHDLNSNDGAILQPEDLLVADSRDHAGIPQTVHVLALVEESNMGLIPSLVAVVADMTRLMHVLKAMDEEPQRDPPILDRL